MKKQRLGRSRNVQACDLPQRAWTKVRRDSGRKASEGRADIMRFGKDLRCVFRFAQASGDDEKIKAVFRDHQDEIESMDMSTSLMALALIGPDHYRAAISSTMINCKEESKGMLRLYFNDAMHQYYVDQVNQAQVNGEARGIIRTTIYDGNGIFFVMKRLEAMMPCSLEKAAYYVSQFFIDNRSKRNNGSLKP